METQEDLTEDKKSLKESFWARGEASKELKGGTDSPDGAAVLGDPEDEQ